MEFLKLVSELAFPSDTESLSKDYNVWNQYMSVSFERAMEQATETPFPATFFTPFLKVNLLISMPVVLSRKISEKLSYIFTLFYCT